MNRGSIQITAAGPSHTVVMERTSAPSPLRSANTRLCSRIHLAFQSRPHPQSIDVRLRNASVLAQACCIANRSEQPRSMCFELTAPPPSADLGSMKYTAVTRSRMDNRRNCRKTAAGPGAHTSAFRSAWGRRSCLCGTVKRCLGKPWWLVASAKQRSLQIGRTETDTPRNERTRHARQSCVYGLQHAESTRRNVRSGPIVPANSRATRIDLRRHGEREGRCGTCSRNMSKGPLPSHRLLPTIPIPARRLPHCILRRASFKTPQSGLIGHLVSRKRS